MIRKSKYYRCKALKSISRQFKHYMTQVKKAKAIYHTMNLFNMDITRKCLIGWCWVPKVDLSKVHEVLINTSVFFYFILLLFVSFGHNVCILFRSLLFLFIRAACLARQQNKPYVFLNLSSCLSQSRKTATVRFCWSMLFGSVVLGIVVRRLGG